MLNGFLLSSKSQTKKKKQKKKEKKTKQKKTKTTQNIVFPPPEGLELLTIRSKDHHSATELPSHSYEVDVMIATMNPIWPPKM